MIALMVEMGIFTALALFLKPLSNLWSSIIFFSTSEIYSLVFLFVMCDSFGIWPLFSLLFIFLWNRKPWLDNFMFIITLVCSKLWTWMGIYFKYTLLIRISRGTSDYVQHVFEVLWFIMIFPPNFKFSNLKFKLPCSYFMMVKILYFFRALLCGH